MATNTLTHSEICSVAANRIKGCTAEQMDNSLKTYTQAMIDLAKEKKPMSAKDPALAIETPLVGYRINFHENGVVKNADGTETKIGANCVIGPNCLIEDCEIKDGVRLNYVQAYKSVIEAGVKIGPFVHIRPNSHIMSGVKIGDFVEIKNSTIGENTAVAHLTYVGDSDVGKKVNFGCGTVTVNYDGIVKSRCEIGDNCFIGCNTNLIAPVKLGKAVYTAAGTTVTRDVPDYSLAIDRGVMHIKEGYSLRKLKGKL